MTDNTDRPPCLMSRGDEKYMQAVAEALQKVQASDYDLRLLTFLCNRLGATPQAVLGRALVALFKEVTGSRRRPGRKALEAADEARRLGR